MKTGKSQLDRIHFISIGGAAMHSIALALKTGGCRVSGSDDEIREPSLSRLKQAGILPEQNGWNPERITPDIGTVILGMHARKDNPELQRALELGLTVYSFPAFLYERTRNKQRVVIGGSHGKTTVTSLILYVLKKAGMPCDFLVGASVDGFDNMASLSNETEFAVFEGDEYLSSALDLRPKFHLYHPHIAVLTGIAWDHVNVFPRYEDYLEQFAEFTRRIEPSGKLIFFREDRELQKLVEAARPDIETIGYATHPYFVEEGRFFLERDAKTSLPVKLFGRHNMQNIAAAAKVCLELGVPEDIFYGAVKEFSGAARRLQVIAESADYTVYHDFAHAPSKVEATVKALRELHPGRRLVACLELHTYSSLSASFLPQYRGSLGMADDAVVFFDPAAVELKRLTTISADDIASGFNRDGLRVFDSSRLLKDWIESLPLHNCNLLFMSSGNFGGLNLPELFSAVNR